MKHTKNEEKETEKIENANERDRKRVKNEKYKRKRRAKLIEGLLGFWIVVVCLLVRAGVRGRHPCLQVERHLPKGLGRALLLGEELVQRVVLKDVGLVVAGHDLARDNGQTQSEG